MYQKYLESLRAKSASTKSKIPRGGGWRGGGGSGICGGGDGFRRLIEEREYKSFIYGDSDVEYYILSRFKDQINIDKTLRRISKNILAGCYLGFKDYNSMTKFFNMDLYNLYSFEFANTATFIFCIFSIVACSFLIIFSIRRFFHKDVPNEGFNKAAVLKAKLCIIIPYSAFYIGFFIYITLKYTEIYKRKGYSELIKIKADPFLEDVLKETYDKIPKESNIIAIIILYAISLCIFILAWILSHHFTKKYLSLLEMTTTINN